MRNKRGQPPLDPDGLPSVHVNVRLAAKDYDRVYALARAQRMTVPELLRRAFEREPRRPARN
jgi:hypothetical protein